jgi:lipopolysaccharide export LptBFGC system permease protein LptF
MTRILDRYIVKELGPPFAIGVGVFTFSQADLLPAALAAWTANIVFAGIDTALFLSART